LEPIPAGRHPRLLFDAGELETLREEARRGTRAKILARLEQICGWLLTPGHRNYFDFRERRSDVWRYRHGIFRVLPSLNCLATGYAFTGREDLGDAARDAVLTIIEHGLADVQSPVYGGSTRGWRHGHGHDKGKFARTLAWVYDFCYDRFAPEQRRRFAAYAKECMDLAEPIYELDMWHGANNRGARGILGNTWLYLALEGDTDLTGYEVWLRRGELAIDKYLLFAHDPQGAPNEGPGYASSSLGYMAAIAHALRRRGLPDYLKYKAFERYQHYLAYQLLPGGGSLDNLNDCRLPCGSVIGCLPLMGTDRGALVPWLGRQLDFHPEQARLWLTGEEMSMDALDTRHLLHFLLWWRDDAPVRAPAELGYPRSHCFREHGIASLRTGWEADDWLVTHICGRAEHACHHQGDNNHINLYALGESFLVDAGYGQAFAGPTQTVDRWFGLTASHNCVLLDRDNQRGWAHGEMLDFRQADAFDTSLGDASSGVGPDHQVRRALRRVVLVHAGPAPYVAVVDANEKDGAEFEALALWHTHPENRIEVDPEARRFLLRGRKHRCAGAVLWPPDAELSVGEDHGRPQLRVRTTARVAEMVTVFCPLPAGADAPRFAAERIGPGAFRIACSVGGATSTLEAAAAVRGPLGAPLPVKAIV